MSQGERRGGGIGTRFRTAIASAASAVAAMVASPSSAGFVSIEVVQSSFVQGADTFHVYKVYAKFNSANDTVLNAYGMIAMPSGNYWHNDFLSGGGSNVAGTWSPTLIPSPTAAAGDSWVTIGGNAAD